MNPLEQSSPASKSMDLKHPKQPEQPELHACSWCVHHACISVAYTDRPRGPHSIKSGMRPAGPAQIQNWNVICAMHYLVLNHALILAPNPETLVVTNGVIHGPKTRAYGCITPSHLLQPDTCSESSLKPSRSEEKNNRKRRIAMLRTELGYRERSISVTTQPPALVDLYYPRNIWLGLVFVACANIRFEIETSFQSLLATD